MGGESGDKPHPFASDFSWSSFLPWVLAAAKTSGREVALKGPISPKGKRSPKTVAGSQTDTLSQNTSLNKGDKVWNFPLQSSAARRARGSHELLEDKENWWELQKAELSPAAVIDKSGSAPG